jgi:pimeloyl-ACP methyl ester carboxylesterase
MSEVLVDGCKIWYEVAGQGETMLHIGGAGFGHENFNAVREEMRKHFNVVEFDLRGYGLSERPEQHYDFDVWADDVAAVLADAGIEKTHVHGTSMGGMVAMKLASKYPELVGSLVISCASAKSDAMMKSRRRVWRALGEAYGTDSRILGEEMASQALTRRFLDSPQGAGSAEKIQGVLTRNAPVFTWTAACQTLIDSDLREDLTRIKTPTLVVAGDEDILTPLETGPEGIGSRAIAQTIEGSELEVMRGIAHTNMLEAPERSVATIVDFVRRTTSFGA